MDLGGGVKLSSPEALNQEDDDYIYERDKYDHFKSQQHTLLKERDVGRGLVAHDVGLRAAYFSLHPSLTHDAVSLSCTNCRTAHDGVPIIFARVLARQRLSYKESMLR